MVLRFRPNEEKALEALVFLASQWPGITPFFVSKVMYFADKEHMNRYGRPVTADTYIAMQNGPVPSRIRDYIEGNYLFFQNSDQVAGAISVDRAPRYPEISAAREPRLEVFSQSDLECLRNAISLCKRKTFWELSDLTHEDRAWIATEENGRIDYELFIDNDNPLREELLRQAREYAEFGVL
jgi:uncharacterized phage-associated protein